LRKLFHLFGGSLVLLVYLSVALEAAVRVYAVLLFSALCFDLARGRFPGFNAWIFLHFGRIIREQERNGLSAMPYFLLGILLTAVVYTPGVVKAAFLILLVGDPSATLVGQRFGRIRINRKSLEGSAAFVTSALVAGALFSKLHGLPFGVLAIGVLAGAFAELFSTTIDDNFTIPFVSGAAMALAF
jgi:dolichol kinase